MKTQKITVNKSPDQPAGQEIDVVVPEGQMEERMLGFSLTMFLRELKREKRIDLELPQRMEVVYQTEGRFVVRGYSDSTTAYYEAPRPLALVGLRWTNGRFDLIHAPLAVAQSPAAPGAQPVAQPQEAQPESTTPAAPAPGEADSTDKPQ